MKTTDNLSESANKAFDKIANSTDAATDALGERGEQLIHAEQKAMENCRSYVRDNPITSLGIAVAAGFLLSRVMSGR